MSRVLLSLTILFFVMQQSAAQNTADRSLPRFGFRLGINYSTMNFNEGYPRPDVRVANVWMAGITAAVLLQVPLTESLYVNPEYAFSQMRGKDKRVNTTYHLNYLSMPVFLGYTISRRLAIKAGPQFDLLINARQNNGSSDSSITHDTEERNLGAAASIEITLTRFVYLEARYMHGISHIGIGQRSNTTEFVQQLVQVNAIIKF